MFRLLLATDNLNLSQYIHIENNLRYVDCKIFVDKLELNSRLKEHPKEFMKKLITPIHPCQESDVFVTHKRTNKYMLFSWFVVVMVSAPSQLLKRTPVREAWIQHWLGRTVPNVSAPAEDYTWNCESAQQATPAPPSTPLRSTMPQATPTGAMRTIPSPPVMPPATPTGAMRTIPPPPVMPQATPTGAMRTIPPPPVMPPIPAPSVMEATPVSSVTATPTSRRPQMSVSFFLK